MRILAPLGLEQSAAGLHEARLAVAARSKRAATALFDLNGDVLLFDLRTEGTEGQIFRCQLLVQARREGTDPWNLPLWLLARPQAECLTRTEGSKGPCWLR